MSPPYYERQQGGNCRIHSLNTLFGERYVTPAMLQELSAEFDAQYESGLTMQFDGVQSDTLMLVSYIIERGGQYRCLYVPLGGLQSLLRETGKQRLEELVDDVPAVLMFTAGHIWTVRKEEGQWWNLDSLRGRPQSIPNLQAFQRNRKLGFLLIYHNPDRFLQPLLKQRLRRAMRHVQSPEALELWLRETDELGDVEPALFSLLRLHGDEGRRCLKEHSKIILNPQRRVENYMPLLMRFIDVWGSS